MNDIQAIILNYKADKYVKYMQAQAKYNIWHQWSDFMDMLDNGIACDMYSKEELKNIIAEQDDTGKGILLALYSKYL